MTLSVRIMVSGCGLLNGPNGYGEEGYGKFGGGLFVGNGN